MSDLFEDFEPLLVMSAPRSPQWPHVRANHLASHPKCVYCGSPKNLNVHHMKPYHLFPTLELESSNLVTLCEGGPINCHYLIGHCLAGWSSWNPAIPGAIAAFHAFVAKAKGQALGDSGLTTREFDIGGES